MNKVLQSLLLTALMISPAFVLAMDLPADPPHERTVELVEQWRLGEDDEDVLLGVITGAVVDAAGQVYLIDRQLSQVLVIGPDGELVTTLGREGDGPGELRQPHALLMLPNDVVGVVQGFPGRIIGLNFDGTPAGDITLGGGAEEGGFSFVRTCMQAQDNLIASTGRMVFDMSTGMGGLNTMLGVYDLKGELLTTIAEHSQESDMSRQVFDEAAEFSEFNQSAVGPDGTIYTAPERDGFLLKASDSQGQLLRTMRRPFTTRKRTQDEIDNMTNDIRVVMNGQRLEVENKALDTDPAIRSLAVAADNRVFVTNAFQYRAHLPEGTAGQYDVLSPSGEFVETLTLLVPDFDGEQDVLFFIDGQRFLVIKNFESASNAMDGDADEEAEVDTDAEPLSVIYVTIP